MTCIGRNRGASDLYRTLALPVTRYSCIACEERIYPVLYLEHVDPVGSLRTEMAVTTITSEGASIGRPIILFPHTTSSILGSLTTKL